MRLPFNIYYMTNREILEKSYEILSPFSDSKRWEFDGNLVHLDFLTKNLPKGSSILDAGCGIGILASALKIAGYDIEGADKYQFQAGAFNAYQVKDIEELQKRWSKLHLKISSKDFLSDDMGKKYDVIVSIATIEHQSNPMFFFNGLISQLKSGGFLYMATPNVTNFPNRLRFLLGRSPVSNIDEFFMAGDDFSGHFREYTLDELVRMFELSGFKENIAINVQSMRPRFRLRLKDIFRLISLLFKGARDTNIVFGQLERE